jgi:anaerobic selenocysteine-containing dehydrogenase
MTERETQSFCRICPGFCGVRVTVEDDRITAVHGDKSHAITSGYICSKGSLAMDMHDPANRLLHPLKRRSDGSFERIGLELALDEIAARLQSILDRDGPEAIALFRGTANGLNATATPISMAFLTALGSTQNYSTMTIDQSAKWVTHGRLGAWNAGRQHMDHSDVLMMFGSNPLVSLLGGLNNFVPLNPVKRIKEAKARGMKLIIIDPRLTETARHADVFLQPIPGEDPTLAAGMLRMILIEGWEDGMFCARHADGIEQMREAVNPFTPDYVAARAGVSQERLRAAVQLFARDSRSGSAASGTGPSMAPRSNLADHLIECLNVVCGRYPRAGDPVANPGAMSAACPVHAEVNPPTRSWETGTRSRIRNTGTLYGERMSGILAEEILTPGRGQIRALLSAAANPASALPNQRKAVEALRSLELLVAVEPFMTTTASLAHYILPTKLLYERADIPPTGFYERALYPRPFAQFTPALVAPPANSELADDWYVYWSLARRLGKCLTINGETLDMDAPMTTEGLLETQLRGSRVPFADILRHPGGILCDEVIETVQPERTDAHGRFDTMPVDVVEELRAVAAEEIIARENRRFSHLLTVRRLRDVVNTTGHSLPRVRRRQPFNAAYMNPGDMAKIAVDSGDIVELSSEITSVQAVVEADDSVRTGVVSMSHGWGGLPETFSDSRSGTCTNLLVRTDRDVESINAMPALSAIPVNVRPITSDG